MGGKHSSTCKKYEEDFLDSIWSSSNVWTLQYMSNSYICYLFKMIYVLESKITIFGQKMMVKSGLKRLFKNPFMRKDGDFCQWICDYRHSSISTVSISAVFRFTAVYNSIIFSSTLVLLSNLNLRSFCFRSFSFGSPY